MPPTASAAEPPSTTLINETFDAQTDPANFGFPTGASIGNGVLNVTENMSNYTTSVSEFPPQIPRERTLDLRFDWKTAIASDGMKTGTELRDDNGRLIFAIAATGSELRYAVTGPDSDSTSAPDSLNPDWIKTGFDRSKWYTVDLHMDFVLGTVQYSITSKEPAPRVMASGTGSVTGRGLARLAACNYYGTGTQSIDNFRLDRPDYAANGSLAGSSVYAFGDSIVYGHKYPRGFMNFLAEREDMTLSKYAVNGARVGPVSGDPSGKILTQVKQAGSASPDFVVFDGGTNDEIALLDDPGYAMGAISSSKDPADFDTSTFAGSLETTIQAMQEKWPDAQLVYVAVHKLGSRDWDTQLAVRDITLQAADKWGVAVADLFADATLDTRDDAQRAAYTFDNLVNGYPGSDGSGTHPNIAGVTEFYVPVLTARLVELAGGAPVQARHSGKCADVVSSSTADGAAVQQWSCWGGDNQQWQVQSVGFGYYQIVARHSAKCLDVSSASTDDGAAIIQWTCHRHNNQQWELRDAGSGYVEIVARHSGKCLTVENASTADRARLIQRTCSGGQNQQWSL
ncbi:hypothetical protein AQJ91_36875 [Streptomyces dysideae]|uniref:Ricin B lectin domain-containing protein n=2 Tax=Streptomyces dysideae TaxID=909626 RepID=A0A117RYW0_9ACTN|nr:hypothetical protein AQJ91_36875 [Streptomyces dysideae]